MVDKPARKYCDAVVDRFTRINVTSFTKLSQHAGKIIFTGYNWSLVEWEAYPRVDAVIEDNSGEQLRLELVYVTPIVEQKSAVHRKIDQTRTRIDRKSLDGLLVVTLIRKKSDDTGKGFITRKGYCLLGYFMASDQIKEMKTDKLSDIMISEMDNLMESDEEYVSHLNAVVLSHDKKLEELSSKQSEMSLKLMELADSQEKLGFRQSEMSSKQSEMSSKQSEMSSKLEELSKQQEELNDMMRQLLNHVKKDE